MRIDDAVLMNMIYLFTEAQKKAEVATIEYEQKIKERESMKKMSSIEGIYNMEYSTKLIKTVTNLTNG